jgi:hypothetical protein
MKRAHLTILISFLFVACGGPSVLVTDSWKNEQLNKERKKYDSIFIIAITANKETRHTLETDLSKEVMEKGLKAIKSEDAFASEYSTGQPPGKDAVLQKAKELGCNAIFTAGIMHVESKSSYTASTSNSPYPGYAQYGTFSGYYGHWSSPIYTPGYYTIDRTYYIESNLFDINTEGLLWSVQTQTYQPDDMATFSKKYTKAIVSRLRKDKVVKK